MLVRHTRPDVPPGVCYGRSDLDVAASFPDDAAAVLAALPPVKQIVTSPLRRCAKLAEHLGDALRLSVVEDPRVQEMDFGAWEGQAWSSIARHELDAWALDFFHARPHGGESVAMLCDRTRPALSEWSASGEDTLIVTHAGVIKAALATGQTADDFAAQIDFGERVTASFSQGTPP